MKKTITIRKILLGLVLTFAFSFVYTNEAFALNRYWVNGTGCEVGGVRNWSNTSCWSASDGGAGGQSVPVSGDTVYFTGLGNYDCVINTSPTVTAINMNSGGTAGYARNITFSGEQKLVTTGNLTINGGTLTSGPHTSTGFGVNVGGSLLLGGGSFYGSSADVNVVSAVTFSSSSSQIKLSNSSPGNFVVGGALTVATGTFDAASASVSVTGNLSTTTGTFDAASASVSVTGNLSTTTGVFSGGSASIDVNGSFSITTGTLTLSSGETKIAGNFTTGAMVSYSNNGGTITFDGSTNTNIDVSTSITFQDVNLSKGGGTYYLRTNLSDQITIDGQLGLINGLLQIYPGTSQVICNKPINWDAGFDGVGSSTYSGFLVLKNDQLIPADQTSIPSLKLDNSMNSSMVVTTQSSAVTMNFLGFFEIVNNGGTGATFNNAGNVNLTFNKIVTISQGNFYMGVGASTNTVSFVGSNLILNAGSIYANRSNINFDTGSLLDINGGTFYGVSSTINLDSSSTGVFDQSGGTFIAPSGTMNIVGGFVRSAGTFTHSNGTIIFDGSANSTISIPSPATFYNVQLLKSTATNSIRTSSGQTINVDGVLTLTNGLLEIYPGAGQIICNNAVDWTPGFDGTTSAYTGFLVLKNSQTIPYGQTNIPSLKLDNSDHSDMVVENVGMITESTMTFLGFLEIVKYNASGATFNSADNVNLVFTKHVTVNHGTINFGFEDTNTVSFVGSTLSMSDGVIDAKKSSLNFDTGSSLNISGGKFYGIDSTINFDTASVAYTQSGGTFNAPSGTMSIVGDFTQSAGVFNHNNGTVVFDGNVRTVINVPTSISFWNVSLSKGSDTYAFRTSSGDTINIEGTLSLNNGLLEIYPGTSEVVCTNDISWSNGFDGMTYSTNYTGYLVIKTTHDIIIPAGQTNWPSLKLDNTKKADLTVTKAGDFVAATADIQIASGQGTGAVFQVGGLGAITVKGTFIMNNGYFNTNGVNINLNQSLTMNGGSFVGEINGLNRSTIVISGSGGAVINGGNLDLTNALALTVTGAPISIDLNSGTILAPPNITLSGHWDSEIGSSFTHNNGMITFNGANANTIAHEATGALYDVRIEKTALANNVTFSTSINIDGDLRLFVGTLFLGSLTHNIAGDIAYVGAGVSSNFSYATSTVVLDGYSQTLSGPLTFYRLTKIAEDVDTLFFPEGETVTITNTATLSGADSINRLLLRSGGQGILQWKINPQATRTFSYLDVQDSNNINATAINLSGTGSKNSGNNTNWSFGEKFWVGSYTGCSGKFSDSDCWADSSGGIGGTGVPGASHLVYFDLNDISACYIDTNISVSGIRVEVDYTEQISSVSGVTITVGAERFLQRDGLVSLGGANMVNTDNFYVYGGTFEMDDGNFSSLDFFYNYYTPNKATANFSKASSMDVNGNFIFGSNTSSSSGTFTAPSGTLTISGNFYSYSGNSSVFNNNEGTIVFDGANSSTYTFQDPNMAFNNLTINKSTNLYALNISSDIDINGGLSIVRGRFNAPAGQIVYLAGDFSRTDTNGIFNAGTSELRLDGTNQTINNSNSFYTFTKNGTGNHTLTFEAGKTTTISNMTTIKGQFSNLLKLRSSSPGTQWIINTSVSRDISLVDVEYSNNTGNLITATSSLDNGNNTNWNFGKKYWVGAHKSTWNDTNNWSLTSGGAGGAGVPDNTNEVVFDNNNDCIIPDSFPIEIAGLTLSNAYTGEISGGNSTFDTVRDLNIFGGSFSVGSKTLTVGRDLYQRAGAFNGGANNIVVAQHLIISGGQFNAGTANTFLVNFNFLFNYTTGDTKDAVADFSGITIFDVNNYVLFGGADSTGSFYEPSNFYVALDFYCGFHQGSTTEYVGKTGGQLIFDGVSSVDFLANGLTFTNVVFSKGSLLNPISIMGPFTVTEGISFVRGRVFPYDGADITVGGTWAMGDPEFTEFVSAYQTGNASVNFVGNSNIITGSTTFANLKKEAVGGGETLFFGSPGIQTITKTMTLKGISTSQRLSIKSTTTMQAQIEPSGPRDIAFLNVENSYNILDANPIEAVNTGSIDSGNNTNWNFVLNINSWVDAFSTFNMRLFTGAYRGTLMIYNILAPYTNGWSFDESLTGAGRVRSSFVYGGALYMGASDGNLYRSSDVGGDLLSASDVANGQYSYLNMVFDRVDPNNNMKMYINGEENSVRNFDFDLEANGGSLLLGTSYGASTGGSNSSGEEYFEGKIDEFRISSQVFTPTYIQTVYNNLNDPSGFLSFGAEEEYNGQIGGTGTSELPSMATQESVLVRGEIGAGSLWISGNGGFADGIKLQRGRVSVEETPVKWLYDEGTDYISFRDSSSPDGFRIDLYMVSEDFGNFVYSGTAIGDFNIPSQNFVIYGDYNSETGVGVAPSKGIDEASATLNIDSAESCSEALDLDNYVFSQDLLEGDFGMSMTGAAQTYFRSNVSCITQGSIDIRAMMLMLPPSCAEGGYSSTLYILAVNGSGVAE